MTIKEYLKKIQLERQSFNEASEKALKMASFATHDMMSKRIFDEGQNVNEQRHQYSKTPAFIGNMDGVKKVVPNNVSAKSKVYAFVAFNKEQRAKTGKKGYYARFFPLGYWEFKKFIGRPNEFVNLKLTGGLQIAFNNGRRPTPTQISNNEWVVKLSNSRASNLRDKLDKKYGGVFKISKKEIEYFRGIYQKEMALIFSK